MTKTEKKTIINDLLWKLYVSNNMNELFQNGQRIIVEVYSSGFTNDKLSELSNRINEIINVNFNKLTGNIGQSPTDETKISMKETGDSIFALIDLSSLPD